MGQGHQLLDIMNEVSARLDHASIFSMPSQQSTRLDEMQAFMLLDPLLADLHKQYMDAKGARAQSQKEYGRSDGMTDMAALLEDSAWCAMQTRYMEVRGNRRLMMKAHQVMDESRREEEERARAEKEREALKTFEQVQMFNRMRQPKEKHDGWLFLFALIVMNEQAMMFRNYHPSHRFNRLAA